MVMIPKKNKDPHHPSCWRPIVLDNTTGKLQDKVVADILQSHDALFHNLQFGSRKGRSALDCLLIQSQKQIAMVQEGKATLLQKHIVTSFNSLQAALILLTLQKNQVPRPVIEFAYQFLKPHLPYSLGHHN